MNTATTTIILRGSTGIQVTVECSLTNSLPSITVVGAGSRNVAEAKERIRGAFAACKLPLPKKRITINLAPADIPKESSSLDLAIAVAILKASNASQVFSQEDDVLIGELGLDGCIRPVRGIIGKLLYGRQLGYTTFIIPYGNLAQAQLIPGIKLIPVRSLDELLVPVHTDHTQASSTFSIPLPTVLTQEPFEGIIGQEHAKRALIIAAAGGHNLLLQGSPGTGKSMLARSLATLLPPLSHEEMLEVTQLHSLSSIEYDKLMTTRPIRVPHHSASLTAMVGGGTPIKPGEVSLAHRGVLFLDEMPEFNRTVLEALRQPLEERAITVNRAREYAIFPANFTLVATANPCPCGYYNTTTNVSPSRACICTPASINQYQRKLSGPLMDRIDLVVTMSPTPPETLLSNTAKDSTSKASIIRLVSTARIQQERRFTDGHLNSDMSHKDVQRLSETGLDGDAKQLLNTAARNLALSARGYVRCIKVARTIADLTESPTIQLAHMSEALRYRPSNPNMPRA